MEQHLYTTGEISRRLGLTRRTLHFYEEIGLVTPAKRGSQGQRLYSQEQVDELTFISSLRSLDISLDEIREVMEVRARHWKRPAQAAGEVTGFINVTLPKIRQRIQDLQELERDLMVGREALFTCGNCQEAAEPGTCATCEVMARESVPRRLKALWLRRSDAKAT